MKFYPQDWRADEKLRLCSLAARGLWIEMLAIMHRSERYGQLLISGSVPTDAQLAVQVGASPSEVSAMLAELKAAGVFSVAAKGVIYSRRMTRDEKKAKLARENGKSGGNPSLRKQREISPSVKGQDKASVKGGLKPQKPEARDQIETDRPTTLPRAPEKRMPPELVAVMQAGRFTRMPADHELVAEWLGMGADLQTDIVPVVERVTSEVIGRTGRGPFKLKLFDDAVRERVAESDAQVAAWRASSDRIRATEARQRAEREAMQ